MDKGVLSRLWSGAISSLFPGQCLHCQLPSSRDMDLCAGCEADLLSLNSHCVICAEPMPALAICGHCLKSPPDFSRIFTPFRYQPPLDSWINRFKHNSDLRVGKVLGQLLAKHCVMEMENTEKPDCLIPTPLHWRRRFQRGFNQSYELARVVAGSTGIALAPHLVKRTRHTTHQQSLDRGERLNNLRNAFTASPNCRGLHIAVVDDVVTTATTARVLASALTAAGAESVEIWALARTSLVK